MRRVPLPLLVTLLPALALLCSAAPAGAALSYLPCASGAGFACTSLAVPLDRSGALPGTISMGIERRLATAAPSRDAVVALAGGPGQATLPLGAFIAESMAPALATRDLLLFDQRGTGQSGPLSCPALTSVSEAASARSMGELVERCAHQLGPVRGAYTTRESVEDIEAIRQAAGYEKLVLYGTSYGTKVALEYAAAYPQHVESLVLDSTETPEGPEPFHLSTFKAMRPMLSELCSRHACDRVSSSPLRDLARLIERLGVHPLSGPVYDQRGRRVRVSVSSEDLYELLLDGDLNPALRAELPATVHSALNGDPAPLARLRALTAVHPAGQVSSEIDFTLFIDTSCEETPFPWQRSAPRTTRAVEAEAALNALPSSDFYPFDPESGLLDQTIPICIAWPDASPTPAASGPLPNVPTLILSGGQDLRTPTEDARRVAALIPDAQLLRVPYTGHSVIGSDLSGCATAALERFFAGGQVQPCGSGANAFPPSPVAPLRLSAVAPTPGVSGAKARTVAAVIDSLLDLRRGIQVIGLDFGEIPYGARFGGLRGGTVRMTRAGAVLNHLSYIPGVQLTGLLPTGILLRNSGPAASLAIGGSQAAGGRLKISSGGRLSGVLAGAAFHVSVASRVTAAGVGRGSEWPAPAPAFPRSALARLR
jgi:pimeloyl-ACP methyl ester carboxylesterase